MTKLEELLFALGTVIIRYHDSQPGVVKVVLERNASLLRKKSREKAMSILGEPDYAKRLDTLINKCTAVYGERKPFLLFVKDEIIFLKTQWDRKNSYDPQMLEEYKNLVTQLLMNFRNLLNITKAQPLNVRHSEFNGLNPSESMAGVTLMGLLNDGYAGNKYCNSGIFIIEEVLNTLNIDTNSSDVEYREVAEGMCVEHQNALLVSEFQDQVAKYQMTLQERDKTIGSLTEQKLALETQVKLIRGQVESLQEKNATLQASTDKTDKQVETLNATILELSNKIHELSNARQSSETPAGSTPAQRPAAIRPYFGISGLTTFAPFSLQQRPAQQAATSEDTNSAILRGSEIDM